MAMGVNIRRLFTVVFGIGAGALRGGRRAARAAARGPGRHGREHPDPRVRRDRDRRHRLDPRRAGRRAARRHVDTLGRTVRCRTCSASSCRREGGLAGAVRAEDRHDLVLAHLDRDAVQNLGRAVVGSVQPFHAQELERRERDHLGGCGSFDALGRHALPLRRRARHRPLPDTPRRRPDPCAQGPEPPRRRRGPRREPSRCRRATARSSCGARRARSSARRRGAA